MTLQWTLWWRRAGRWVLAAALFGSTVQAEAQAPSPTAAWAATKVPAGLVAGVVAGAASGDSPWYARTDKAGAFRWDAVARQWVALLDWLPPAEKSLLSVESLAVDPTDARKLYLFAGGAEAQGGKGVKPGWNAGAVLRSNDQGRHFEVMHVPIEAGVAGMGAGDARWLAGERLAVDANQPQTLYLGTRVDGLWRSVDAGMQWHRVREFGALPLNRMGITFVTIDASSGPKGRAAPVIVAGLCDPVENLMWSEDSGKSWKPLHGGPAGGMGGGFPVAGVFAPDGVLYVVYAGGAASQPGSVWAFLPKTRAWREVTPACAAQQTGSGGKTQRAAYKYSSVAVAGNAVVVAATQAERAPSVWRSTDAGTHWEFLPAGTEARSDAKAPASVSAAVVKNGGAAVAIDAHGAMVASGAFVWVMR